MSAVEENIVKQAKRCGDPIPDRIKNKPKLRIGLEPYLDAFHELHTERQGGFGLTQIPWSSIVKYTEVYELSGEAREDMLHFVRVLDDAYIALMEKRQKNGNTG
jgi:hypothetical protein